MSRWLLAIVSLLVCNTVLSQDLFESANSTTRTYNYLELQYLVDIEASPPLKATLLLDIASNWSLKAEYLKLDQTEMLATTQASPSSAQIDVEAQSISIGALFHAALPVIKQTDWIAGLMLGRTEIEGDISSEFLNFTVEDSRNFQEAYLGLRRSFSNVVEGEATVNYRRESDDNGATADVTLVFRAFEFLDVALAGNELGGNNVLGLGLRYTW